MSLGRVLCFLVVMSLATSGVVFARQGAIPASVDKDGAALRIKKEKGLAKNGNGAKADKGREGSDRETVKGKQGPREEKSVSLARSLMPQAPIVMGRSVSDHHSRTKIHHVKMKPLEAAETRDARGGT